MLAEGTAATIGSYFAGYIFDAIGSYDPAFWTGFALSIMGIIFARLLKPLARNVND